MKVYTLTEARQNLSSLLERAVLERKVRIKRKDGQAFVIKPETSTGSPLDIEGMDLSLTKEEIVNFIVEGRRKH